MMEIKYCDNCGDKICPCYSTTRRIIIYDGDSSKNYEIDLCDYCFRKLDKHIRRVVARYKSRDER